MPIQLPNIIHAYFTADKGRDAEAVSACFTDSAVVTDEGHTHTGRPAIAHWKAEASNQYTYAVEPFALATQRGQTVVTSHLVGNFPGSPVDLRYLFTLQDDHIAALEIKP
ncbi:nuclear transport factor 2 family protein [Polymorphobacter sp.]|uniref:nuclear transport factor 2 family protein n=1 Tax=Polymorphobacter sp. TaxID=1909290 RepID=UPI003F72295D